jgi:hypothetical protein
MDKQAHSREVLYVSRAMLSLPDSQIPGPSPKSLVVGKSPITGYIQEVSQPAAKEAGGSPKNHTASVRKLRRQENVVSIRSPELLDDLANLSGTALRHKYPREANSHRNGKTRSKGLGFIWHPEIECFKDFLLHLGQCPGDGYTLDRIDSSDPEYAPGKVRWASKAAQTHNRHNTRYLTNSQGLTYSASEWSRRSGKPARRIMERVDRYGWSVDEALSTPLGGKRAPRPVAPHSRKAPSHHSSSTPLVSIWMQLLADVHGHQFCSFSSKDQSTIKRVANRFESDGLHATEVLTYVLTHWTQFTRYARDEYGAFGQIPAVPTLEFLEKYCNAAGNFFLQQQQEDIEDARRQADSHGEVKLPTVKEALRSLGIIAD